MQKITSQQLQYIDRYLKNSNVHYDDIRYEMTDHIASAIETMEGNFYDNLYYYMANHKKELMDNNRNAKKMAGKKALALLGRILIRPMFHMLGTLLFGIAWFSGRYYNGEDITFYMHMAMLAVSTVIYLNFWHYKIFSKTNHSVIDKLLTIAYLAMIFIRIDKLVEDTSLAGLYYAYATAFFIMLAHSLYCLKQKYKLRYGA